MFFGGWGGGVGGGGGGGGGGGLACVYQLIIQTKKIFENFWIMLKQKINKSRMMKQSCLPLRFWRSFSAF